MHLEEDASLERVGTSNRALIVLNPTAGSVADPAKHEQTIRELFSKHGWQVEFVQLDSEEHWKEVVCDSLPHYEMVIAAGGDGTVSSVAELLVKKKATLGILPVGTGNVLAKALDIPMNIELAVQMLVSGCKTKSIDAMRVNGRLSLLNASVGITSRTVGDMRQEEKRSLGMLAYFWRGFKALAGYQPHLFHLVVDDQVFIYRAAEIFIVNPDFMGIEPFYWGDDVHLDDGKVDLFVVRGRTIFDFLRLVGSVVGFIQRKSTTLLHIQAKQRIWFNSDQPQPVQIDGDVIGMTPVEIEILPASLKIAVPDS
jgi:diacylglycerol kinase (ATP)